MNIEGTIVHPYLGIVAYITTHERIMNGISEGAHVSLAGTGIILLDDFRRRELDF